MVVPAFPGDAPRPPHAARRYTLQWRNLSLYARVVVLNTAIFIVAALALVITPVTVSFPVAAEQGAVLAVGVLLIVIANAVLLRMTFRGLADLERRMETLDVLQTPDELDDMGGRETRALIAGFNAMRERLAEERRTSARRTLFALEAERRRIGQELHDEIGQRLTGTLLQLRRLYDEAPDSLRSWVASIQDQERATLDEVGELAWQLRPALLDDLGLLSAIKELVASFRVPPALHLDVSLPAALPPMSPEAELVVYRITQEALTNAIRHSKAQRIELSVDADARGVTVVVADNGQGISKRQLQGPGIRGMQERALLVNSRLQINGQAGPGVCVKLEVANDRPPPP